MDLLTISVEARTRLRRSCRPRCTNGERPLDQEFARLLQEMQLGMGQDRRHAAMADRTSLPDLKSFCSRDGAGRQPGNPHRHACFASRAKRCATKRRQRAEEKAQQVPVRMMIPLVCSSCRASSS